MIGFQLGFQLGTDAIGFQLGDALSEDTFFTMALLTRNADHLLSSLQPHVLHEVFVKLREEDMTTFLGKMISVPHFRNFWAVLLDGEQIYMYRVSATRVDKDRLPANTNDKGARGEDMINFCFLFDAEFISV